MKTCTTCGAEIVNGVNGCAMYDQCTDCRPIHYPLSPTRGPVWMRIPPISDDDLRRAEDDYYDRVESYWDD